LNITQFEGKYIEDAGMLKMDFLGLTTLSIIKDTVKDIKRRHDVEIDINEIPLDDAKTFELYQAGDTIGTFQFESDGMRAYLKELKPTDIEDLIAMNALYRPGPMSMIPEFIDRKYGRKKIEYAHESLIPILENTYGIMVYQEQIMQTAQIMGGFTLGAADILRRAMGKKKLDVMQEQKEIFVKGAREKNIDQKVAEEVFGLMERFAEYGFNRSHSTAYSILAFHTAYLKAHYPAEYMAAVLTHNMSNLKKIDFYLNSVRKMGLEVLGPDINESYPSFTVNQTGAIRFGLAAVKGVGQKAMDEIVTERDKNGSYRNLFELTKRLNIKLVNKRCFESLVYAGALDCFKKLHRAQYFYKGNNEDKNLIEIAIKFASALQAKFNPDQHTLFGKAEMPEIREPDIYDCEPWSEMELLKNEKEVTGIYLSGHPLDRFKIEIDNFCSCKVSDLEHFKNKDVEIAGMISGVRIGTDKYGKQYAFFTIEDYSGKFNLSLFSEGYLKMRHFLVDGETIFIKGRMQMRNNFDDRIELRIKSMMLLNEVLDKEIRFINIHIPLSDISDELMNDLNKIIEEHPGKCELKIKVFDQAENISVMLPSQNVKLHVDRELIKSLESVNGLKINLN
ncbi:MAG: DNA polymerase III subunit alpha, partial [Bacteroidetes bacterium]|nr:DNA polymerase III subunit alpha [Bacteroidota bacterium]